MSAKQPTKRLYIDFMVPCSQTKLGNTVIFVCLDQFTNFVWLEPMRKASTGEVARFLEKNIFYQFAVPELMHSDNGKQFVSQVFAELLTQCGIRHVRTGFYAPQANAAEKVSQSVLQMLRATTEKDQRHWDSHLS